MSSPLHTILNDLNGEVSEQLLLGYLNGTLSDSEREKVEQILSENPFAEDAVQGLAEVQQKEKLPQMVRSLKTDLKKTLKTPFHKKRKNESQAWHVIAAVIIFLLLLASWMVLRHLI